MLFISGESFQQNLITQARAAQGEEGGLAPALS